MSKGRIAIIPHGSRLTCETIDPFAIAVRAAAQCVLKWAIAGGSRCTRDAPFLALDARGHRQQMARCDSSQSTPPSHREMVAEQLPSLRHRDATHVRRRCVVSLAAPDR